MSMLKGIDPIISPELLKVLAEMGHGDELVIADANFPAQSTAASGEAAQLIRYPGVPATRLAKAVLSLMPLDTYAVPAYTMQVVGDPAASPGIYADFQRILDNSQRRRKRPNDDSASEFDYNYNVSSNYNKNRNRNKNRNKNKNKNKNAEKDAKDDDDEASSTPVTVDGNDSDEKAGNSDEKEGKDKGKKQLVRMVKLERFAFYERAKSAYAVVQTGEVRLYGNLILKKGIISHYSFD